MGEAKELAKEAAKKSKRRAVKWMSKGAPALRSKVKLTFAFLQVLSIFGLCFQVDWPTEYEVVIRDVNAVVNLSPVGPVAASCIFPGFQWNWHHTLLRCPAPFRACRGRRAHHCGGRGGSIPLARSPRHQVFCS